VIADSASKEKSEPAARETVDHHKEKRRKSGASIATKMGGEEGRVRLEKISSSFAKKR